MFLLSPESKNDLVLVSEEHFVMAVIVVNSNGFACTLYSGDIASFNRSNKYFFTLATLRHLGRVKDIVKISESTLILKKKDPSPLLEMV